MMKKVPGALSDNSFKRGEFVSDNSKGIHQKQERRFFHRNKLVGERKV